MVKPAITRVYSSSSSSSSPTSCNDAFSTNNSTACKMYKGVRKRKWGKWVSEIRLPNSRERIWLGSYDTQEKAARAFDAALYCLRGKGASFNFPDTPHLFEMESLKIPCSHQEIQEVAAKFANKVVEILAEEEEEEDGEVGVQSESMSEHTTQTETNRSFPIYDGGTNNDVGVDKDTMDWTFMNMLDDLNGSDFGLYFEAEKGEFLCPTTHTPLLFHNGDEIEVDDHDHDAFSNHSFLWSWNF